MSITMVTIFSLMEILIEIFQKLQVVLLFVVLLLVLVTVGHPHGLPDQKRVGGERTETSKEYGTNGIFIS